MVIVATTSISQSVETTCNSFFGGCFLDASCSLTYSVHRFLCSYINMVRNITRIITNTCQVGRHTCGRTLIIWRLVELQGSWYRPAVVCKKKFTFRRKSSTEKILENIATFTVQLCITPHQIYNRGNAFGCIINNLMGT